MDRPKQPESDNLEGNDLVGGPELPHLRRLDDEALRSIDSDLTRQGQRDTVAAGDWVERGILDVDVAQINVQDSWVKSTDDFHKVSHDEMVEGFRKLDVEVRPAVHQGRDSDYFSQLDDQKGLDYQKGYRRIYDAFYGDDAIRLEKMGDTYNVTNGYHRLFVARELGIETVPAYVIEQRR